MRDLIFFTTTIFLIVSLAVTGYFYQSSVAEGLVNDFTGKIIILNDQIDSLKKENEAQEKKFFQYEGKLQEADKKVSIVQKELKQEVEQKSTELKQELKNKVENIKEDISVVKKESEKQIEQITGALKEVEIKNSAQVGDLKKQLSNLGDDLSSTISQVIPSVVSIKTNEGVIGSGAIIHGNGFVITNNHVVKGSSGITIELYNGQTYSADFIGGEEIPDLAILRIKAPQQFNMISFETVEQKLGDKVVAIGSPGGLKFTVTQGIISSPKREIEGVNYVQTDVAVNPGNSGGPLINKMGKIVGITTIKIGGYEGIGFAISSNSAKTFVEKYVK